MKFTKEELCFIEATMDLSCSILDNKIHQITEDFLMAQTTDNNELKRLCASRIIENGKSQLIIESIRTKIELWRLKSLKN